MKIVEVLQLENAFSLRKFLIYEDFLTLIVLVARSLLICQLLIVFTSSRFFISYSIARFFLSLLNQRVSQPVSEMLVTHLETSTLRLLSTSRLSSTLKSLRRTRPSGTTRPSRSSSTSRPPSTSKTLSHCKMSTRLLYPAMCILKRCKFFSPRVSAPVFTLMVRG